MSLEAKGTIKYDPEAKMDLVIKAPTLYIEEQVQGVDPFSDLNEIIDLLITRITEKVIKDFGRPAVVSVESYTCSLVFTVDPIKNRTLDEFDSDKVIRKAAEIVNAGTFDGDGYTVRASLHDPNDEVDR